MTLSAVAVTPTPAPEQVHQRTSRQEQGREIASYLHRVVLEQEIRGDKGDEQERDPGSAIARAGTIAGDLSALMLHARHISTEKG